MRMSKFTFSSPVSLAQANDLLSRHGAEAKVVAGGTDLVVQIKNRLIAPEQVISLLKVQELAGMEIRGKQLRIGALVKHATLESSPLLKNGWEILSEAAKKVGSPQIRNLGTVGGNLCNASPAADTAPSLLVLESEIVLVSQRGERRIPLDSFFTGPGSTILAPDELLKEILVPECPAGTVWACLKLGRRKCMDLALVSMAVLLNVDSEKKVCRRARIALGAVAPTPLRAKETEKFLEGKTLKEEVIREASQRAQEECRPISDIWASADYRKEMVKILLERAIKKSLGLAIPPTGI